MVKNYFVGQEGSELFAFEIRDFAVSNLLLI